MTKKRFKNEIEIAMLYIGCVIGAGFASGQETLQFFSKYGSISYLSIVLMGVLFGLIAYVTLNVSHKEKIVDYQVFQNKISNKWMTSVFTVSANVFMFICLSTMFAGSGALIEQGFEINSIYGTLVFALLSYIVLLRGAVGIIKINKLLTITLIIGSVLICLYIVLFYNPTMATLNKATSKSINALEAFKNSNAKNTMLISFINLIRDNWIVALLLYVSYNLITTKILLVTNSDRINRKKGNLFIAILSGLVFATIGLLQNNIIFSRIDYLSEVQIPILAIVMSLNQVIQYLYMLMIILAMFTTSITCGWALVIRSEKNHNRRALIICLAAIVFAQIGFSGLVANIYPLFGYIGLVEIILIFIYNWKGVQKNV